MSLKPAPLQPIPAETVRIARAAFPKGSVYMRMRDELGTLYEDAQFQDLFPVRGQPAASPWRLALVTIMQFAENLPDREAAEAVRGRIDWKYALGLELDDAGFDRSVLSEFRTRLLEGSAEQWLLEIMLEHFQERGLLKGGGRQRTDSTHILGAIRTLNRLELVGETLRHALNSLAVATPDWLKAHIPEGWYERYGRPITDFRLPRSLAKREQLAEQIGADGFQLFAAFHAPDAPAWLRELPAVEAMRQIWIQQYVVMEGQLHWRQTRELPPGELRLQSPYDLQTRYSKKRQTEWIGYKVHLTESCEVELPHLIVNIETTAATTTDYEMTPRIHQQLAQQKRLPKEHFVDTGYVTADHILNSRKDYAVELVGPVQAEHTWRAHSAEGFSLSDFVIDWEAERAICPQGHRSSKWQIAHLRTRSPEIHIRFPRTACRTCPVRSHCTKSAKLPRSISIRPREVFETLQAAREQQQTTAWQQRYRTRAGVEGTISQSVYSLGMRQARYRGQAKTNLQHILTAAAVNLMRVSDWLAGIPRSQTRVSRFAPLANSPAVTHECAHHRE
jgi:transposase